MRINLSPAILGSDIGAKSVSLLLFRAEMPTILLNPAPGHSHWVLEVDPLGITTEGP